MAYYLAVERKPDSYEAINIKKTPLGRNLFLNDSFECTLEEIDCFTTQYINLEQLTHELYCDKFISWQNSSVATVYVSNGEIITIERDMLFKASNKYLDNPYMALEYLINELSSCNIEFARELSKKIVNPKEREKLETLIKMMEEKLEKNIPLEMTELIHVAELLVYHTDDSEHINEPRLYEYSKIHNMALVIAKYENKLKQNSQPKVRKKTKNT